MFGLCFILTASVSAKNILIVGDSLSAGYGIDVNKGWVKLLQRKLSVIGDLHVVNESVSGATSFDGLNSFSRHLKAYHPEVVVIQLGANDALRGLGLGGLKKNLTEMVKLAKEKQAKVLLVATRLPPNYGALWVNKFQGVYRQVADSQDVPLVPLFLKGVAGRPSMMQADRLHPTEKAQSLMLNNVWPALKSLVE